jgi:DNA-directed RNA polymerase sigma subunit (sigma70/sigma32)
MLIKRHIISGMKREAAKLYIEGMEINEIGVEIGVTRERVRQLLISTVR